MLALQIICLLVGVGVASWALHRLYQKTVLYFTETLLIAEDIRKGKSKLPEDFDVKADWVLFTAGLALALAGLLF